MALIIDVDLMTTLLWMQSRKIRQSKGRLIKEGYKKNTSYVPQYTCHLALDELLSKLVDV
jgi:hypothetical protein